MICLHIVTVLIARATTTLSSVTKHFSGHTRQKNKTKAKRRVNIEFTFPRWSET